MSCGLNENQAYSRLKNFKGYLKANQEMAQFNKAVALSRLIHNLKINKKHKIYSFEDDKIFSDEELEKKYPIQKEKFICSFCQEQFLDKLTLNEHMRDCRRAFYK